MNATLLKSRLTVHVLFKPELNRNTRILPSDWRGCHCFCTCNRLQNESDAIKLNTQLYSFRLNHVIKYISRIERYLQQHFCDKTGGDGNAPHPYHHPAQLLAVAVELQRYRPGHLNLNYCTRVVTQTPRVLLYHLARALIQLRYQLADNRRLYEALVMQDHLKEHRFNSRNLTVKSRDRLVVVRGSNLRGILL